MTVAPAHFVKKRQARSYGMEVIRAFRNLDRHGQQRAPEVIEEGLRHFADHCATCHGNDGSGRTSIGQGLFPKPPDLRAEATQSLTDGELFYVIENGVRFTGMPGFATGTEDGETASWQLVRFIRALPRLSEADISRMESLNPRSPDEIRREIADEQFLQGGSVAPAPPAHAGHEGAHR